MYGWEGQRFDDIESLTRRRDPRHFRILAITTDGQHTTVQCFRNLPELQQYLARMEPQRWGLRGSDLLTIKPRLESALTPLALGGPSAAVRAAYNDVVAASYRIVWWGSLEDFIAGADDWSAAAMVEANALADKAAGPEERAVAWLRACDDGA